MARIAKPIKMGSYRHEKLGVTVDLMFSKSDAKFLFELAGTIYRQDSMAALQNLAHHTIEAHYDLEWIPIIEVEKLTPFARDGHFIGFELKRMWIAKKQKGGWVQHRWEEVAEVTDPADEATQKKDWLLWAHSFAGESFELFKLERGWRAGERSFHIPYTLEAWDNLERTVEHIGILSQRLDDLLTTKEGIEKLSQPGQFKLLTA